MTTRHGSKIKMTATPILWSFRRCPYAIRARLALASANIRCELREILLRDKPAEFLATSSSATVPCLKAEDTIDESRDIMIWALSRSDPENWLARHAVDNSLIDQNDGPFKTALDHTKYASRYPDRDPEADRGAAADILHDLNDRLTRHAHLTGADFSLADAAILPFVRQFALIDRAWFDAQDWPALRDWLDDFLASRRFASVMQKHAPWQPGENGVSFPA